MALKHKNTFTNSKDDNKLELINTSANVLAYSTDNILTK